MDEAVLQAMQKWPQVPAVYGWLRLDRRGQWHLIDRGRPDFDERLHGLGGPVQSPALQAFIGRNYAADAQGQWFFQNGPQRVYVQLQAMPWVLRVLTSHAEDLPMAHRGQAVAATQPRFVTQTGEDIGGIGRVWLTDEGDLVVDTTMGPALINDRDLASLEPWLQLQDDVPVALALDHLQSRPIMTGLSLKTLQQQLGIVAAPQPTR